MQLPSFAFLDEQRQVGDIKSDNLVKEVMLEGNYEQLYSSIYKSEYELNLDKKTNPISQFLLSSKKEPSWYDEDRLLKGQEFYESFASEIMTLLGILSLPFLYAGSPGNKALYMSEKLRNNPGKRLMDTAQFTIDVSSAGSFTDSFSGHLAVNKTRLTHSIARYYVSKYDWNSGWGFPINQEDMAGTNLGFSYIILNGLRRSGFSISKRNQEDYLYLWKYIGYQLGINEDLLPDNMEEAAKLTKLIKHRNFKKSKEGVELTKALVEHYKQIIPGSQSEFITSQMRYFLGPKVSYFIGLPADPVKDNIATITNSFTELQNSLKKHRSSYDEMIRNYQKMHRADS